MLALLLSLLLTAFPADPPPDLEECLSLGSSLHDPPVVWGENVEKMWADSQSIPRDSLEASLSEIREVRSCLLALDPSEVNRPYLDDLMRTFYIETAFLAGLRRFPEAFETFEEGRAYLADQPLDDSLRAAQAEWIPILHQNQGYLHYLLGDLPPSTEQYLKAYETTPESEPRRRIQFLVDIGIIHQRMQNYRSALGYYRRAEERLHGSRSSPDGLSSQRARLFHVQADLLLEETSNTEYDRQALERARDLARQARQIAEPGSERHIRASLALAEALGYLESFEEAYVLNEEAHRHAQKKELPRLEALAQLKRGILHMQTEQWAPAEAVLEEAQALAEQLRNLDYQRRIYRALGRLHELQENWATAEEYYREGISVIEEYRESLTATQWSMTAFSQWQDVHRGLVRGLLAQGQKKEALAVLDRTRARHLQDLRTQARLSNELSPNQRVRYDSLTQALTDVRNELTDVHAPSEKTRLRDREAALMVERRQLLEFDSNASRPTLDMIQDELGQTERFLVSYFIDDPWPIFERAPRSTAFVVTEDTLHTVPLPEVTQPSIRSQVEAISSLFSEEGKPESISDMHFDLQPLHELHEQVYAPVADFLPDERPLTVVPDGPLFHVSPSMLVRSMPEGRYGHEEARFVLHDRPTSLKLASSLVADTGESQPDWSQFEPELAAFGVSDFETFQPLPSGLHASLPTAPDSSYTLPSLPGVQTELNAVQKVTDNATVAYNEEATETAAQNAMERAGVLHLASHAFVHPSSPLQNAFLLHPDSSSNGVLFLHELQAQECQIPLVVLSGCSTARGTLHKGEGLAGLQYAFRAMGAQSTVANLWPAADEASVELMSHFYQHLREGRPKDRALRQAKLDYLQDQPGRTSPFFWGATVLYGSPAPVQLGAPSESSRWAWSALGLLAVLILLGLLFWRASPPLPQWLRRQLPS